MRTKNWNHIGKILIGVTVIMGFLLLNTARKLSKLKMDNKTQKEKIALINSELDKTIQALDYFYFNAFEI